MKDLSDRRAVEASTLILKSGLSRIGTVLWAVLVMATGASMASIMAVATFHEVLADDFFGVGVGGMVVVFGMQLVNLGYDMVMGGRKSTADPNPLDSLWRSDDRICPYLPYSQLEIRGR